jgi:asparagine synthase (glutamine-hydrolysing)
MCGIAGILNKRWRSSSEQLASMAQAMANRMLYRGPDDSGVWIDPEGYCALSHRRLSIIDTSAAGHQPMLSANGRAAVTYNGELYNYLELKPELQKLGEVFHTRSDTEVLLSALAQWGTEALSKFDAMFAFGYYDVGERNLLLARDIFGEKPLYYVDTADYFAFASELHALEIIPSFDPEVDLDTIATYLTFQYVPCPQTIYARARKLPPGCYLRLKQGRDLEVSRHFEFRTSAEYSSPRSLDDLADELESILLTSIQRRLLSDVPLGAFLSSGVDSSTIAALVVKKLRRPLKTFSIGFTHPESEHLDAAMTGRQLGTHHHEQVFDRYPVDLGHHIGEVLDEPNGDSSCVPTYLVSQHARETVTVVLSGDGGDEMFGGYGRYFATIDEHDRKLNGEPSLANWSPGDAYISNRLLIYLEADISRLLGFVPEGLGDRLARMRGALNNMDSRPLINVLREVDAANYLPGAVLAKVDRMSMQHSLEVRAPFLGRDVAQFAMRLAGNDCYGAGQGKLVLKQLASRYLPREWMERPKRGFGIPIELWSKTHTLPDTRKLIASDNCRLRSWIDRASLTNYVDHLEQNFSAYQCWHLFILEKWLRTHRATPVGATTPKQVRQPVLLHRVALNNRIVRRARWLLNRLQLPGRA